MLFVNMTLPNSLRLKVLLAYVAGMMLSITLLVIVAVVVLQSDFLIRMDLADAVGDLVDNIKFDSNGRPVGFDASLDDMTWLYEGPQRETAYRILDETGKVMVVSSAGEGFWPVAGDLTRLARGTFDFEHDGMTIYGATEAIEHDGKTWYLQFAASARFMDLLHSVAFPLVGYGVTVFGIVTFVAFGLCAYVTLRYTLKPLGDVSDSAAAISPRSLHARLQTKAIPTEIEPLVNSFNRVLERLEQGYRIQQEFLSTAAHELKTPLALIRAQIELIDDGDNRKSLLNDVEHMTRQVQQLLLLAEASEGQNYTFTAVDVLEVATEAARYLQRMADAASVRLVTPGNVSEVQWQADRGALFTLFKNMLENAIQHAPRGTEVLVEVTAAEVSVRDWGPGVSLEQLQQIFSRFWRGAHRRDHGAGLGLAICQEIALAHGWTLSAYRAEPGLRLCLSLPHEQSGQLAWSQRQAVEIACESSPRHSE
ncbi:ATP-binding protein [Rhodoferax sp. BLA1]|uniref:HAMP domain-containing sensor histidine kinase n=1 Tax=Rhodoferax sp. BLA1 TaxID=2576062 RepID=UPI0015D1A32A|nr:ATP-binding protein [Rhodoferax sp. BLA1]